MSISYIKKKLIEDDDLKRLHPCFIEHEIKFYFSYIKKSSSHESTSEEDFNAIKARIIEKNYSPEWDIQPTNLPFLGDRDVLISQSDTAKMLKDGLRLVFDDFKPRKKEDDKNGID